MAVCACGGIMPKGAGWCNACHFFWLTWLTHGVWPDNHPVPGCECIFCRVEHRPASWGEEAEDANLERLRSRRG